MENKTYINNFLINFKINKVYQQMINNRQHCLNSITILENYNNQLS